MITSRDIRQTRRRGLVSVAVLIALIIIAIISAGLLKVAFARRARVTAEERQVQAAWLAESGLERALSRLATSNDYTGETWEIPAEDLGGRGTGIVLIQVEKLADQPSRRKLHVQADFPANSSLQTRQSREIIVPIPLPPR
jgi:type II secretory pathway pseudopilin PulG